MGDEKIQIIVTMRDDASTKVDGLRGKLRGLGTDLKSGFGMGVGFGVTGMVTQATAAIGDFVQGSIQAASSLEESQSKVNVVFGDSADAINEWAEDSAQAFGMSKQQALAAAGTYGNLFQAFGVGQEEAAGMSKSLVQLAADLASFNDTSVDDALVALRSGLSGETEPLKRYGIAISDARMRTKLAEMGFRDLGSTLTPLQKTTAAYALIMQDSALAQGDVARTSDSLANTQRRLDAEMANLSAEVGTQMLPIMRDFTQFLADDAVPVLKDFVGILGEAGNQINNMNRMTQGGLAAAQDLESAYDQIAETTGRTREEVVALADTWVAQGKRMSLDEFKAAATDAFRVDHTALLRQLPQLEAVGEDLGEAHADSIKVGFKGAWGLGPAGAASPVSEATKKRWMSESRQIGEDTATAYADAVRDAGPDAKTAWKEYVDYMKDPLKVAEEIAWIKGKLASKKLQKGLNSEDPITRAQAQATAAVLRNRLGVLEDAAYDKGRDAKQDLYRGWNSITRKLRLPGIAGDVWVRAGVGKATRQMRHMGGPVEPGMTYLVGERGPELLHMGGAAGYVTPNHKLGSGGGTTIVQIDGRELFRFVDERMGRQMALSGNVPYSRG